MDSTIKYLTNLTAEKFIKAGLMVIISFLATGWSLTEYSFSKYRYLKEAEINEMQRAHTVETISFYNRIIDGQTKRQDKLDSALSQVRQILENKSK